MTAPLDQLIALACEARSNAYAPYSNHPVGAVLECDDGGIYSGANVENAAYPLGCCAEASAISAMITAGKSQTISRIIIAGPSTHTCTPCGGCRQRLNEFAAPDTPLILCNIDGEIVDETTMETILPNAFGPNDVHDI